jgi:hypothetical protein
VFEINLKKKLDKKKQKNTHKLSYAVPLAENFTPNGLTSPGHAICADITLL